MTFFSLYFSTNFYFFRKIYIIRVHIRVKKVESAREKKAKNLRGKCTTLSEIYVFKYCPRKPHNFFLYSHFEEYEGPLKKSVVFVFLFCRFIAAFFFSREKNLLVHK